MFFNKNNFEVMLTDSDFVLRNGFDNYIEFYVVDTVGQVALDSVDIKIIEKVASGRDTADTVIKDYTAATLEANGNYSITLLTADAVLNSEANIEFIIKITYDTNKVSTEQVVGIKTSKV